MNPIFLLLFMIFCHIVDDYYLQGWLASAKQKKWQDEHAPQSLYMYDYLWALIMHSFSWSFMIMLPVMIALNFHISYPFCVVFVFNVVLHAFTDNLKANEYSINLWQDQAVHMFQIIVTWLIYQGGIL